MPLMSDLIPHLTETQMAAKVAGYKRRQYKIEFLAICTGKCRRTIIRWCALGYVPGAFKTTGGHWRIPPGTDWEAVNALAANHSRKSWKKRFADGIGQKLTAALQGLTSDDVTRLSPDDDRYRDHFHEPTSLEDYQPSKGQIAEYFHPDKNKSADLRMIIASRELKAKGVPVNLKNIAEQMGISRSMLYRRTSKEARKIVRSSEDRTMHLPNARGKKLKTTELENPRGE